MQSSQVDTRCISWLWPAAQVQILTRSKAYLDYSHVKTQKSVAVSQNITFSYGNISYRKRICPFANRIYFFRKSGVCDQCPLSVSAWIWPLTVQGGILTCVLT